MDDIAHHLFVRIDLMLLGIKYRRFWANEDLAEKMVTGALCFRRVDGHADAVGEGRVVEELLMQCANLLPGDKMDDQLIGGNLEMSEKEHEALLALFERKGEVFLCIVHSDFRGNCHSLYASFSH